MNKTIYHHLNGEINHESADKIAEWLSKPAEGYELSLYSHGGDCLIVPAIAHWLSCSGAVLHLTGYCYSAAFYLALSMQNVVLHTGCIGMFHYPKTTYEYDARHRPTEKADHDANRAMMQELKVYFNDLATGFMTMPELKRFRAGEDVYFTTRRMKEIFL